MKLEVDQAEESRRRKMSEKLMVVNSLQTNNIVSCICSPNNLGPFIVKYGSLVATVNAVAGQVAHNAIGFSLGLPSKALRLAC
jgi:hypothetical protein